MLHSLSDGCSLSIILNDVLEFYEKLKISIPKIEPLPFLPMVIDIEDPNGKFDDNPFYKSESKKFEKLKECDFNIYMPYDKTKELF